MSVLEWGHRRKLVEERDKSREVCTRGCDEMGDDPKEKKVPSCQQTVAMMESNLRRREKTLWQKGLIEGQVKTDKSVTRK